MKTKKRIAVFALVAALIALLVGGMTMAYFTDQEDATNTFTVGNVDIQLTEPDWVAPETTTPGVAYDKNPTVTNIGKNDAWIRVNVTLSDWDAFSKAAATHNVTDLTTVFGGFDDSKWTLAGTPKVDTAKDTITYSYYYNAILEKGENTGALFTTVTVPASFTSEEMAALGDDFTINVTADAIQKEGFTTPAAAFAAFDAN